MIFLALLVKSILPISSSLSLAPFVKRVFNNLGSPDDLDASIVKVIRISGSWAWRILVTKIPHCPFRFIIIMKCLIDDGFKGNLAFLVQKLSQSMFPSDHLRTIRSTLDNDFYFSLDIILQLNSVVRTDFYFLIWVDEVGKRQSCNEFISYHIEGGFFMYYQFFFDVVDLEY